MNYRYTFSIRIVGLILVGGGLLSAHELLAGTLSCTVATSCPSGTVMYRMADTDNAHGELPGESSYPYLVCCTGVAGMGNSCSGTHETLLKLSSPTNAHGELSTESNYSENACISVPAGGSVTVGYQTTNCNGYDTTVGSLNDTTNAHLGDANAYAMKICATAYTPPDHTLTFSISDNTIGFGTLSSVVARYATGDTLGASSDSAPAHTISVATNADEGYALMMTGTTLICAECGDGTIAPIGGTPTASTPGTDQFGMRVTVASGTGTVSAPYHTASWAFDTAAFPDMVATGAGDSITTVYEARYIANISAAREHGTYTSVLTYVVTPTF